MEIKNEKFLILSAESTHLIIQLEKNFIDKKISCRVIPLPTEISASCGLAVRVELGDTEIEQKEAADRILHIVKDENIKVTVSLVEKIGFKKNIEKLYTAS